MIRTTTLNHARTLLLSALLITGLLTHPAVKARAASSGTFALTASLNTARYDHTATLLQNGQVLVAGGVDINGNPLPSAELYNPATGRWIRTGSMSEGRSAFTATLLPNGDVLVAGGEGGTGCLSAAELYDPSTAKWTSTGSMTQPRCSHSAALLQTGQVLAAGGGEGESDSIATAELYNPATGTWHTTGSLNFARANGAAALLANGQVLLAGGYNFSKGSETILTSAELYHPSTGLWGDTGSMAKGIFSPAAVLLTNNHVLIANGAQLYNPTSAAWVNTDALPESAENPFRATLLSTGNVMASGTVCSYSGCGHVPSTECFLYTASTNSWSVTGFMHQARVNHTSTLLPSGKVLVAGGDSRELDSPNRVLSSAELYEP
jgi:N-acetylneuraminic acid mutarotase